MPKAKPSIVDIPPIILLLFVVRVIQIGEAVHISQALAYFIV